MAYIAWVAAKVECAAAYVVHSANGAALPRRRMRKVLLTA
jgi:hypothetical protein